MGGGVAGAISSISLETGFVGYLSAFVLGGIGSIAGGWISGSVTDFQSAAIAFGIGAIANIAAVGLWTKSAIYSFTSSGLSSLFSGWY